MNMETFIIIVIIAVCFCIIALGYKAYSYLKSKMSAQEAEDLDKFVGNLVYAAEQMLKSDDDDGSRRLGYVEGMLIEAGHDITESLRAIIESKVYALNIANRKINREDDPQ